MWGRVITPASAAVLLLHPLAAALLGLPVSVRGQANGADGSNNAVAGPRKGNPHQLLESVEEAKMMLAAAEAARRFRQHSQESETEAAGAQRQHLLAKYGRKGRLQQKQNEMQRYLLQERAEHMPRNLVAKGALMEEKETLHEEAGAHHDGGEEAMVYRPAAELESAEGLPAAPWESNANSRDHQHNMMSGGRGHDLQEPPSTAALHTKMEHSDSRALQSLGIGTGIPAVETDPKVCYICEPTTQLLVPDETAGRRCVKRRRTPGYTITENVYMTTEQTVMKIDTLEQCEALGGNELEDAQRFCRDVNLEAWTRGYDNDILCLAYKRTFSPDCCRPMNQERCEICGSGIDMPYGVMEPTQQNGGVCKAFNQEDFVMSGFTQMHVFPNSWRQQFYVTPAWDFGETSNLKVGFPAGEKTFVLENGHYRAKLVTEQSALSPCTHVGGTQTRPYRAVMACLLIHQLYMRVENLVPGGFYRYELFQHLEPNPYTLNVTYFTTMDVQRFSHGDTPVGSSSPGETAGGGQNQLSAAYQMPEPYTFHPAWDAKDRKRDLNAPAQEGYATADGDGVIRFRLYAAGARDTVVLSGLNIKRAANKRGAQNAVLIDRMHSQQRCAVTGGYEVVGDVTCEEVQYHYASNFRKNSEGCLYLQERFTHGYCAPGGVRVKGCCRQGNPPPQFCSPAEQAAAVAAALAAQARAEEQEQTDLVAEIVGVTLIVLFVVGGIVFYCFGRQLLAQVRVFLAQEENRQFFARMTENNAYGTKVAPGGMKKKKNKAGGGKRGGTDAIPIEDLQDPQQETGSKQGSKDGDDARDHAKKVMSRSATRDSITSSRGGGVGEKDVDVEAKDADAKSESGRSQSSKHSRRSSSKRTPGGAEDDETGGSSSSGFSDSEFTSENASTLSSEAERKQRHKERKAERIRAQRAEHMASLAKTFFTSRGWDSGVGSCQPSDGAMEATIRNMKEREIKKRQDREKQQKRQEKRAMKMALREQAMAAKQVVDAGAGTSPGATMKPALKNG